MIVSCCCQGAMLVGHLMCVTGWRHGWRTKRSAVVVEGREWWPRAGEAAGALRTWSGASSNTLAELDGVQVMPVRRASSQRLKLRSTSLGWSRRTRSISCYACGIPSTSSKKCAACKVMRYWCVPFLLHTCCLLGIYGIAMSVSCTVTEFLRTSNNEKVVLQEVYAWFDQKKLVFIFTVFIFGRQVLFSEHI